MSNQTLTTSPLMQARSVDMRLKLVGKTIVEARYLYDEEKVLVGLDHTQEPVIFMQLSDETQIIVQSDAEGNDAGRILIFKGEIQNLF